MRGTRRLALLLMTTVTAILLAAGIAVAATIQGGAGNNTITGTEVADSLYGGDGNDTISGLAGSDDLRGQNGDDTLYGISAEPSVAPGNDQLIGGYGNDDLNGGSGADTLNGGPNADHIVAGPEEDVAEDTVSGGDGPDVISTYDIPADRDVVNCGLGEDQVTADSLDQLSSDCETVERVQQAEPQLAPGVYALDPAASSECDLGRGTLTVGTDAETGERGVEITFEEAPASEIQPTTEPAPATCAVDVDYNNVAPPPQGEVGTTGPAEGTLSYEGTDPPPALADEAPSEGDVVAGPETAPPTEEAGAQYAWRWRTYRTWFGTYDPGRIKVAETYNRLSWWHNGYNVAFDYKYKSCYSRSQPKYWPKTHWYIRWCYRPAGHWFSGNSYVRWIGTSVEAGYRNCDFRRDDKCTYISHKVWAYGNGNGYGSARRSYNAYGDYYWLLVPWLSSSYG